MLCPLRHCLPAKPLSHAISDNPDLYLGIFFSKSRREEVVEVDEEPEYTQNATLGKLPILSRGDWMRGCPEASEQTHLFSLYNKASEPSRKCNACSTLIPISKGDLLTIYVRTLPLSLTLNIHLTCSLTAEFRALHRVFTRKCRSQVPQMPAGSLPRLWGDRF